MLNMDDSEDIESVTGCIDHWLNPLTAYPTIVGGVKFRWTSWLRLMHHSAISNSKPIQEPAFHGRLMELNACDSTAHTACFIISQSALNPHLFSCAPILVSPGSDWWSSAVPLVKKKTKEEKKKKREKSLLQYALSWAIKDDWTFHVPIWRMKTRQIASAPPKIEIPGERDSLCEKLYGIPLNQTQTFTYTLTNHLESVNSSTLCSIRAEVHFKP